MQKNRKPYPRYYQNEDGTEQIYLESPVEQIYVRAIKKTASMDYCYYAGPLKKSNIEDIKNRFRPATEAEFKNLFNQVIIYFATMAERAPKLLPSEARTPKLEFNS